MAETTTPTSLALAGPRVAWRMFTTLSADERVMWIVWTWGIVLIAAIVVAGAAPNAPSQRTA